MYYLRHALTILFTLLVLIASSQSFSNKDLNRVLTSTQPYSIIGMGEAEHFRQGYYQSKFELIKYLVENNGADLIALEASINVTAMLNDYISNEADYDLKRMLAALNEPYALQGAGLFDANEIVTMIEWLKRYNAENTKKIRLVGIDFQNYSVPLTKLGAYADGDADKLKKIEETKDIIDGSLRAILDSGIMVISTGAWLNHFQKAQHNVQKLKEKLGNSENAALFLELEQFTSLWDNPTFPRDSMMYENLKQHLSTGMRVLVWAHNFHIENDAAFDGPKKLGVFLKESYPKNYFVIGISDQEDDNKPQVIFPYEENTRYDMMLKVRKGDKCERL